VRFVCIYYYKILTEIGAYLGIRMLDQPYMTDLIEANSMGHEPDLIDIYSASWGPTDDGRTVDGPRNATMRAIVRGVNEVRIAMLKSVKTLYSCKFVWQTV